MSAIQQLPRRWEWRVVEEKLLKQRAHGAECGQELAGLEKLRRFWSDPPSSSSKPRCKALKEIRIAGIVLEAKAWKRLMLANPGPRLYAWPTPDKTKMEKHWDKWDQDEIPDGIDDPSESITYRPAK